MAFFKAAIFVFFAIFMISCRTQGMHGDPFGVDRSRFSQDDETLFFAVRSNNLARVDAALRDNPNVNVMDRLGQTAFMWACWNGNLDIVRALLDYDDMHRRQRTRRHQRLDVEARSRNPDLMYSALLAFIMSGVNSHNPEAINILNRIINRSPRVLELRDYYGETIIHKVIRSDNIEFLDAIVGRMNNARRGRMLNSRSNFGQSPLQLAVQLGNRRAIDWLIGEMVENGITISDFADPQLPAIAFNDGNGDLEAFIGIFMGKIIRDLPRVSNDGFLEAVANVERGGMSQVHDARVTAFIQVHYRFTSGMATSENLDYLNPEILANARDGIFEMVSGLEMDDAAIEDFFARLEIFPEMANEHRISADGTRKSLLQYIIERQSFDVFERFMTSAVSTRLSRSPIGYNHFFNVAMMNRRIEHMRFILSSDPVFFPRNRILMTPYVGFATGIVASSFVGEALYSTLQVFCIIDDFTRDQDLLSKMAVFYHGYLGNPVNRANLIILLISREKFDVFDYFLSVESDFHNFDFVGSGPVFRLLLNRRADLARSIVNFHINRGMRLAAESENVLREMNAELWRAYSISVLRGVYSGLEEPESTSE